MLLEFIFCFYVVKPLMPTLELLPTLYIYEKTRIASSGNPHLHPIFHLRNRISFYPLGSTGFVPYTHTRAVDMNLVLSSIPLHWFISNGLQIHICFPGYDSIYYFLGRWELVTYVKNSFLQKMGIVLQLVPMKNICIGDSNKDSILD